MTLLIGQSISLGLILALLIVSASALFLPEFGSSALPYVYIAAAVLGSLLFYGYAELQKHVVLPTLGAATLVVLGTSFFLAWLGLTLTDTTWILFALMVAFPLTMQLGFVLLGGQAGRLFDVRQVKRLFPRVVTGFALGFLVGGFVAPPLSALLGGTKNIVLAIVAVVLFFLGFLITTNRRYRSQLTQAGSPASRKPSKSLWQLLGRRFVLLIVAYQMLAAMVFQLIDFILFDRAAIRFTDSEALTQFFGGLTVAVNLIDILFLALFAGLLLSRFGLNFGLAANPVTVGIMFLAQIIVGVVVGPTSALFFGLVILARLTSIVLNDGTTRGSTNTAYQALPADQRVSVQTGVEGIAAPVALGLTGVVLLIFSAIPGLSIMHVILFALVMTVLWALLAALTYGDYSKALTQTLRRRSLGSEDVALDDRSSLTVVERLLHSDELREVRLALDLLERDQQGSLDQRLVELVSASNPDIRSEALTRIERLKVTAALPVVAERVESERDPATKGRAIRVYCALMESDAVKKVLPYLNDEQDETRLGAAAGLLLYGGIAGVLAAGERLAGLEHSTEPAERCFVARVIGEVGSRNFYQPLLSLLTDEEMTVRREATVAAGRIKNPRLLPLVIGNLSQSGTRSAAVTALVANGEAVLPYVENALENGQEYASEDLSRLARLCGLVRGEPSVALLKRNLNHPNGEVRFYVFSALGLCDYQVDGEDVATIITQIEREVKYASRLLLARQDVGEGELLEPLFRALGDEFSRARQRIFLLLSFIYDARAILRAEARLSAGDGSEKALALEMLDVTLTPDLKALVFPLIEPDLTTTQRISRLGRIFSTSSLSRDERLREIVSGGDGAWTSSWTRSCAIYAAGKLEAQFCVEAIEAALSSSEYSLRETAAWALYHLAPNRYRIYAADLAADPEPAVARLAAELAS